MTVKLSISVPDDVAAYLQNQGNASAAAAQGYGEYLRSRTKQQIADDQALIESSNDIALRDAEW